MTNKQIRNTHARNYIEAVFAERLRAEGFVPSNSNLLYWYRIVDHEIINSIGFFSRWSNLPLMMEIGYGIYPLFVTPFHHSDVYLSKRPWDERFCEIQIKEGSEKVVAPYSKEAMVMAPQAEGHGLSTLEDVILPQMNSVRTIEACYRANRKISQPRPFGMSITLIDEAILLNDILARDNCKRAVEKMLLYYQEESRKNPARKEYTDILTHLQIQKEALCDGNRDAFLADLELRKRTNLALMQKKYGIVLNLENE